MKEYFENFSLIDWVVLFGCVGSTVIAIPDQNLSSGLGWFCATLWFLTSKEWEYRAKNKN